MLRIKATGARHSHHGVRGRWWQHDPRLRHGSGGLEDRLGSRSRYHHFSGGELRDAPLASALFLRGPQFGNSISKFCEHGCVDISRADLVEVDLRDEGVYRDHTPADRTRGISELVEFAQVGVKVRRHSARPARHRRLLHVRHCSLLSLVVKRAKSHQEIRMHNGAPRSPGHSENSREPRSRRSPDLGL